MKKISALLMLCMFFFYACGGSSGSTDNEKPEDKNTGKEEKPQESAENIDEATDKEIDLPIGTLLTDTIENYTRHTYKVSPTAGKYYKIVLYDSGVDNDLYSAWISVDIDKQDDDTYVITNYDVGNLFKTNVIYYMPTNYNEYFEIVVYQDLGTSYSDGVYGIEVEEIEPIEYNQFSTEIDPVIGNGKKYVAYSFTTKPGYAYQIKHPNPSLVQTIVCKNSIDQETGFYEKLTTTESGYNLLTFSSDTEENILFILKHDSVPVTTMSNIHFTINESLQPAAPSDLSITSHTEESGNHLALKWTVDTNASKYNIYKSTDNVSFDLVSSVDVTFQTELTRNFSVTEPNKTYYFKVSAIKYNFESAKSESVSGMVITNDFFPDQPNAVLFGGNDMVATGINITFDKIEGVDSYIIKRGDTPSNGSEIATVNQNDITGDSYTYTDTPGVEGTIYAYRISAVIDGTETMESKYYGCRHSYYVPESYTSAYWDIALEEYRDYTITYDRDVDTIRIANAAVSNKRLEVKVTLLEKHDAHTDDGISILYNNSNTSTLTSVSDYAVFTTDYVAPGEYAEIAVSSIFGESEFKYRVTANVID